MTQERDDFEHRLGQGLKRWAEAGQPTMNLEAFAQGPAVGAKPPRRAWKGWLGGVAAAAGLILVLFATFPAWAGAASGLPIVGDVVREIILKDAGLAWAYENGLLEGTIAEATDGEVTVRILGVMADQFRTTIIYQITGVEKPSTQDDKPIRWGGPLQSRFSRPVVSDWPEIRVKQLPGQQQIMSSAELPKWTPVGLLGTFKTSPVGGAGEAKVQISFQGRTIDLAFDVSRERSDRFSREVPVGRSQTVDDVTVTVHSVVFTPVETVVRFTTELNRFYGSYSWGEGEFTPSLQTRKTTVQGSPLFNQDGMEHYSFPVVEGSAKLVFPALVKAEQVEFVWPLEKGAQVVWEGTPIRLDDWARQGDRLYLSWTYMREGRLVSFAGIAALDGAGGVYSDWKGQIGPGHSEGRPSEQSLELVVPEGVTPVAVRATQVGVKQAGPWVFDLPQR